MTDTRRRERDLAIHQPELLRLARRLTRSREEAEDLVQETLLKVWARIVTGGEVRETRAYLFATLRNLACRPPERPDPLTEADEPAVPSGAGRRIATEEVLRAMRALPGEQACLIRALALEGVSYAELARRHGLPVGTVMSRVSRGRARLSERLGLPKEAPVAALLGEEFSP